MPKIEIEVGDDGAIGTLPEPLQKFLDGKINQAFGKGAEKAAKDVDARIEEAVKKARDGADPAVTEKAKNLEIEVSKLKEAEAIRAKNFDEAKSLIEQRHATEMAERAKAAADEVAKRDRRLQISLQTEIRAEAVKAGTRDASLDEVSELLAKYVGLDADLAPAVHAEAFRAKFTDSKLGADGKAVSIEGLVAEYLSIKTHHKAAPKGTGGGARGGASMSGAPKGADAEKLAVFDEAAQHPSMRNLARAAGQIGRRVS